MFMFAARRTPVTGPYGRPWFPGWGGVGRGGTGYQDAVQYVSCFNPNLSRSLHGKHPPYSVDLGIYPHL